jgi:endonuclease-3
MMMPARNKTSVFSAIILKLLKIRLLDILKKRVMNIYNKLAELYGKPVWTEPSDPLPALIKTILSQNTNDANRDRAYRGLRQKFPSWEDVLSARPSAIATAIKAGGLSKQKSRYIKDILKWIKKEFGELSLDAINDMTNEEAIELLSSQKGIGVKTAAVVLMFCCGRDVCPVDTHVHRISKRLGLVPENASAEKAYYLLGPMIPKGKAYTMHMNFLSFGKSLCPARNPHCYECPLYRQCIYENKSERKAMGRGEPKDPPDTHLAINT